MKSFIFTAVILAAVSVSWADTTITKTDLDYVIYLPDNWVLAEVSDSQDVFWDTTWTFKSQLSLVRHTRNSADFPTAEEWSRAHFIASMLVAEYSVDPWGAVLYYDSSTTSTQGSLWAPELYAVYFSVDTTEGAWAEYVRYPASGNYGYELYAMGDTTDMLDNLATYGAILQGIEISGSVSIRYLTPSQRSMALDGRTTGPDVMLDALGRKMPARHWLTSQRAAGVYLRPQLREPLLDLK